MIVVMLDVHDAWCRSTIIKIIENTVDQQNFACDLISRPFQIYKIK